MDFNNAQYKELMLMMKLNKEGHSGRYPREKNKKKNRSLIALVVIVCILAIALLACAIGLSKTTAKLEEATTYSSELENDLYAAELVKERYLSELREKEEQMDNLMAWKYPLDEETYDLLSRVIYREAGNCKYGMVLLVAETVRDRSIKYNKPVKDILLAKNQFASPYTGTINKKAKEKIDRAILEVFKDGFYFYDGYILHFHNTSVNPKWNRSLKKVVQIDNVIFYN